MDTAYFDSAGGLVAVGSQESNNALIKNALILIEGTHKDNKGRVHHFPAERIQRLVDNSNAALATGVEIPLMLDHSKALVSDQGLRKLGEVSSNLECRIISERDLPNPKMRHLIGKLGAFSKVAIKKYVDDVKNGLIKLLSPGVDIQGDRIAEVSAVAFPAIHGPALFSLNYTEAKEQQGAIRKLKDQCQECFDILFGVIRDIDGADENEMLGINRGSLKRKAVDEFVGDLLSILGLDEEEPEEEQEAPPPYAPLPAQYSQWDEEEIEEELPFSSPRLSVFNGNGNGKLLKTRRRK
ncbi:hypothetical protein BZZ01_04955 [Nostocales cyanobacterium HT-58-2]|nr:hypothetical protein BZZ01_04955 [Nostocales cyanobacterium HT-58-2]